MIRSGLAVGLLAAALLFAACGSESVPLSDDQLPIARVNDRPVPRGLYDAYVATNTAPMTHGGGNDAGKLSAPVLSRLLDDLLREQVLVGHADQAGVQLSLEEQEDFLGGLGLPGRDQLHEQASFVKRRWLNQYLEDCLRVKKFLDTRVTADMNVSQEQVQAAYEANLELYTKPVRYRLRQIRVQSLRQSRNLNNRLRRDGTNFDAIANGLNDSADAESDPELQGRELGMWTADQLPVAFAKAITELQPGRVTKAIEDPDGGYNYFQLVERLEDYVVPFEEVSEAVRSRLVRQMGSELVDEYLAHALNQARVEIVHENLDFSYVPPSSGDAAMLVGEDEPNGES